MGESAWRLRLLQSPHYRPGVIGGWTAFVSRQTEDSGGEGKGEEGGQGEMKIEEGKMRLS